MRLNVVVAAAAAAMGSPPGSAQAAEGDLDPSFGTGGIVVTASTNSALAVALQPNGRIVAVGNVNLASDFGLVRYNQDGSLDPSFGIGGKVVTDFGTANDNPAAVAIQADGRIVVAGRANDDVALARYDTDGELDPTFGSGIVTAGLPGGYTGKSLAIQPDGRIVVAGSFAPAGAFSDNLVMRFLPDGTFDPSFGSEGIVTTPGVSGVAVAIQNDGKIVTAGGRRTSFDDCAPWDPCDVAIVLVRYNRDGTIDPTFGTAGMVTTGRSGETNLPRGMVLQADGRIVVVGSRPMPLVAPEVASDFLAIRYDSNGTPDPSFGVHGEVVTDVGAFAVAKAVALQADGKILVAGGGGASDPWATEDFALVRYEPDGALDTLFAEGGKLLVDVGGSDSAQALAVQPDGKIVLAGGGGEVVNTDFSLVRVIGTPHSSATVGLVDPSTGEWYLRDQWGVIDSFYYGNPGDVPFMGDWDSDGVETPGLYRQSDGYVYLRNSNTQGIADIRFFFGNPGDVPLAGDFNGDGFDTVSIYRPSEQRFYIINELGDNDGGLGAAEYGFMFGNPGDQPVVGDWDGDDIDEIGLYRESTGFYYYRNTLTTGIADAEFFFGDPGDRFVAGDWGIIDGRDTPAVFRPSNTVFYFRHTLTQGNADSQFTWPEPDADWVPLAGYFGAP